MRALVLSGGGSHGAFQVGAIRKLTEAGKRWDVVAGVSVGALNASLLAQYEPHAQRNGAVELETIWANIRGDGDVYGAWPLGKMEVFFRGSLYHTKPLQRLIAKHLDKARLASSGVALFVGAVSLSTGRYRSISGLEGEIAEWVRASSTFPLAFEPVVIDGEPWVDGGVRDATPIRDVVALSQVDEIDVILTAPETGEADPAWDPRKARNGIEVAARCAAIAADEVFVTDLQAVRTDKRVRVYCPDSPLTTPGLCFEPNAIKKMIARGYAVEP